MTRNRKVRDLLTTLVITIISNTILGVIWQVAHSLSLVDNPKLFLWTCCATAVIVTLVFMAAEIAVELRMSDRAEGPGERRQP